MAASATAPQVSTQVSTPKAKPAAVVAKVSVQDRDKALKILAKSIFKELRSQGYEAKQIVGLATEILAQVTDDLSTDSSR